MLIGVAVIATESTAYFGADRTSIPLRWLYEHLVGPVSSRDWGEIHHYIRKTGHFTGYGLIGVAWLHAWWMTFTRWSFFHCSWMAIAFTALIAASDEMHQSFLPNRTGMFSDVLLDCCGALVLQIFAWLMLRLFQPRKLAFRARAGVPVGQETL